MTTKPNRRDFLKLAGIAAVMSGCTIRLGTSSMPFLQRSRLDHNYTLPSEEDLENNNLVEMTLDVENEFHKEGMLSMPYGDDEYSVASERFRTLIEMFEQVTGNMLGEMQEYIATGDSKNGDLARKWYLEMSGRYPDVFVRCPETEESANFTGASLLFLIDRAIQSEGFKRTDKNEGIHHVTETLNSGEYDCDTYSFMALGLAERFGLPVYGVTVPMHMFVRWDGLGFRQNLDQGSFVTDKKYLDGEYAPVALLPLHPESIEQGAYMRNMSKRETMGIRLASISNDLLQSGDYAAGLDVATIAAEWAPLSPISHQVRAMSLAALGRRSEAAKEVDLFVRQDPNYTANNRRLFSYMERGR
jgi:hypothetical protein